MPVSRIPYSNFQSFSRLFSTYAGDFEAISSFFPGDFRDPRQRGQIALQVADHFQFRSELRDILAEQNAAFGASESSLRNVERLANPETVAVVTGQQLGLFSGPLYTLYKTVTAIQLASRLEQTTGRPAVPVFWLEGEDHDFAEVASASVYHSTGIQQVQYGLEDDSHLSSNSPVGRIRLNDSIGETIDALEALLPPTEFRLDVIERVRKSYRPNATFLQSFVSLMGDLFKDHGLVFVTGDDPRLKRIAAPLFRKEIRDFKKSAALLKRASGKLEDVYHVQARSEPPNLFLLTPDGRKSLTLEGSGFGLKGSEATYSEEALLSLVDEQPEMFSPNVVLRPIYQDTILPTAAYVAGPGEIAYFSQFKTIYEWAGIPMPIIYPRASVTLLESKTRRILERFNVSIPDFETPIDKMFHSIVVNAMDVDAESIFERAGQHIHDAVNTVGPAIEAVDHSLGKSAESTRVALMKEWNRLKDRVLKAEKRRHEQTHTQLSNAQGSLFPGGALQERVVSPLYFMNKYGPELIDRLMNEIELDTSSHQVLSL